LIDAAKDSDKRQLAAIAAYAKANGFDIVDTYYNAAVSGADPVTDRAGFAEMLERLLSNGARTIIVESQTVSPAISWSSSQGTTC
jgi:DNA invertase Pin-like site-specific DNA recombinase